MSLLGLYKYSILFYPFLSSSSSIYKIKHSPLTSGSLSCNLCSICVLSEKKPKTPKNKIQQEQFWDRAKAIFKSAMMYMEDSI